VTKLSQVCGLLFECVTCTLVAPDLGLERDVFLKVKGLVDEHCERLILEEEIFFFGTKNTTGVRVLAGSEVACLDGATATVHREDLGEWGGEVVLDKRDGDSGGAIEHCDVAMVGVRDPTRAGVDTDEGSIACGGATSLDEVTDKVVDSHDNGRVIDFGDGGRAVANVVDLLNELFSSLSEVVTDGLGNWLQVEWQDWEDRSGGVNCVDFVAIATDEGVLLQELFEHGGEGDSKDPTHLGNHGCVLRGQLLVHLRVRDGGGLGGDLLGEAAFGGSA
jgi:hypothetical protein